MSNIPMLHPVTAETVQRYAVNSGMIAHTMDFDGVTDAETFLAKVMAPEFAANLLGATSGNTAINENRSTWSPDHNGKRIPFVGDSYLDTAQPSIACTLVEMTPANIKIASGAADVEGENTKAISIRPRATFQEKDYLPNVVWFTNYGTKGIIGAEIQNALCTTGMNWSVDDKKVATCNVEFKAHSASPVLSDNLPIRYFIYLNAEANAAAVANDEQTPKTE